MFKIYADGQLLYEPDQKSDMLVVGPTCDAEAGLSGQLSFTMLPGHYLYDTIKKLKTEIVATLDDEEIFRGRILNWDIDFYKSKKVHCEGDISYLLDSMQPPHDLRLTPTAYLTWMISEHNIQVDAPKRFTIGQITIDAAATEHDFIDASFRDTRESIDSDLINVFGGFLRTRRVGAVTYLDYLKEYTETGEQALEFGSNLIDLTQSLSSDEIFTILLPTGEPVPPVMEGAPSWPLTIESVNNGSKLLENVDAVAQFGRIVKNQFFEKITDPAALKAAGEDFLEKAYKAPFNSYTIQGLDLHLLDKTIQQFKIGLLCRIRSAPHGIDLTLPIVRIAWDFDNPDATEIVIAPLVREPALKLTSNSGGISNTVGQVAGGKSGGKMNQLYKYYTEGQNWAKIQADKISLISGDMATQGAQIEINKNAIDLRVKKDEVINAINVSTEGIKLAGSKVQVTGADGIRLSAGLMYDKDLKEILDDSYSRIEMSENEIDLRVTKAGVINAVNVSTEGIKLMGTKVEITGPTGIIAQGNLAVGDLSAVNAAIENLKTGSTTATHLKTVSLSASGNTSLAGVGVNSLVSAGNITSNSGAISGVTLKQGGTALNELFLGKTAKAADSHLLDGYHYDAFSFAGHNHNDWYLGKTAKAADSDLLDGYHYDAFSFAGHTHASLGALTVSSLTIGTDNVTRTSKTVVTGVGSSGTTIDGKAVLTSISPTTTTIYYYT